MYARNKILLFNEATAIHPRRSPMIIATTRASRPSPTPDLTSSSVCSKISVRYVQKNLCRIGLHPGCRLRTIVSATPEDGPLFEQVQKCPVPLSQQPSYELRALKEGPFNSWGSKGTSGLLLRLGIVGGLAITFIGAPIANFSYPFQQEPLPFALTSLATGLFFADLLLLRLYLSWTYVQERLLSATVEYEETGWYDGQLWVKDPQMLSTDRLISTFEVQPVVLRLRSLLVYLGTGVAVSVGLAFYLGSQRHPYEGYEPPVMPTRSNYSEQTMAIYEGDDADTETSFSPKYDMDIFHGGNIAAEQ